VIRGLTKTVKIRAITILLFQCCDAYYLKEPVMGRWQVTFTTISPRPSEGDWEVGVHESHIKHHQHHGHQAPLARLVLVQDVLSNPLSVFEGWSRPEKEDCYVYVGDPKTDFHSLTIQKPAPPNYLFLVFILPDGTIDLWNWRARAPGTTNIPEDVRGKLIWDRTRQPPT
jgi:hypothetical protein